MTREKDLRKIYIDLVSHFAPKTMISESMRALRTNVLSAGESEKARIIAVTSSYPREGKSMVSVNLSVSLAQAGLKTLLVGIDFRSPALGEIFSIENGAGLTEVLQGNCPWQDTIKTVTDMVMGEMTMDDLMLTPGLDNLNIITSGSIPDNPTELLNSNRFTEFIDTIKQEYDIIIFDSAPVLTTADTAILGSLVDALLIVYQPEITSKKMLKRTASQLKQVKSKILGVVLNSVKPDLIPDALRDKYSEHHSADTVTVKQETEAEKDKKKIGLIKILAVLVFIILLASGILWKTGVIFPEKYTPPKAESKNSGESSAVAKPAEKDIIPEEKEPPDNSETSYPVTTKQEEPPFPAEEEIQTESKEKIKPEYREGNYPYSVYLGSFKSMAKAKRAVDEYSRKGIHSYPVKLDFAEKGIWYRVYSGYYPDTGSARVFIKENNLQDAEVKKTAYACYLGSFTDNESLDNYTVFLKGKGYFPYVITDHNKNIHFMLTGALISRSTAGELSEELRVAGIENEVVTR